MVNTRTSGLAVPERTLLQLQRDLIASQMRFDWPRVHVNRPNEDSRGMENGGELCYQSSVLQTFMHAPPFLRWIGTHHTVANPCEVEDCLKCYIKQLADDYWGETDPTDNPVSSEDDPGSIANMSVSHGFFESGEQDDAVLFYTWLLDQLYEQPP